MGKTLKERASRFLIQSTYNEWLATTKIDLEKLTICAQCGCVFDFQLAMKFREKDTDPWITVCPACKSEYELPAK